MPKQYIIEKTDFSMPSKRRLSDAFTLVELPVVIAIIGLLAGLVVPVMGKARESSGDWAKCMSNMRQISSVYQKDVEIYKKLSCSKALVALGDSKGSDQNAE
jgi:prepilin-type N-terminal cleavage/methylation domain-containing protein